MAETKKKKIKIHEIDSLGAHRGWECVNYSRLQPDKFGITPKISWPDGKFSVTAGPWTLPVFVEPPHIVIDRKIRRPDWDVQYKDGCLFISGKFRNLIKEVAPDTCEFRPCVTEFRNGEQGPEIWLCSPIKAFAQTIDLVKSHVQVSGYGFYMNPGIFDRMRLSFVETEMVEVHLFRIAEMSNGIFCDDFFKMKCREAGIKSISFKEIGELPAS
ncbi:hypothetical protein ABID16_000716 [Rhizobium aquaticum]|uniref:Immunity MXAN-0049 protein domain-containing protein n=1 Tax=Rhizobium aquaticum TaxID=1549636 RepID=A0ABV2IV96_9HYPH